MRHLTPWASGKPPGDEIGVEQPADPDRNINPHSEKVDVAVGERDLHCDRGVLVKKAGNQATQIHRAEGWRSSDPQYAMNGLLGIAGLSVRVVNFLAIALR